LSQTQHKNIALHDLSMQEDPLHSSSLSFVILKWSCCSLIINSTIFFMLSMISYNDVFLVLSNVHLGVFSLATFGFKNLNTCTKSGNNMHWYHIHLQFVRFFPSQHIESVVLAFWNLALASLLTCCEFYLVENTT
jgi:hypothetical protein